VVDNLRDRSGRKISKRKKKLKKEQAWRVGMGVGMVGMGKAQGEETRGAARRNSLKGMGRER
jgi:hypothetical protein